VFPGCEEATNAEPGAARAHDSRRAAAAGRERSSEEATAGERDAVRAQDREVAAAAGRRRAGRGQSEGSRTWSGRATRELPPARGDAELRGGNQRRADTARDHDLRGAAAAGRERSCEKATAQERALSGRRTGKLPPLRGDAELRGGNRRRAGRCRGARLTSWRRCGVRAEVRGGNRRRAGHCQGARLPVWSRCGAGAEARRWDATGIALLLRLAALSASLPGRPG